jgi:hypothetical protein
MARYKYQGTWTDGNGRRIDSATVSIYLAGTTTAASVYAASAGGSPVNSVTTDTSGYYSFWIDDGDYTNAQLFKIIMSKANFQSKTIDDIAVIQNPNVVDTLNTQNIAGGKTFTSTVAIKNSGPRLVLAESDASADNIWWDLAAASEQLRLRVVNDAGTVFTNILTADRVGTTVDGINLETSVGIQEATPSKALDVKNGAVGGDILCYDIYTHDGGVETSDERLKENIQATTLGLDFINNLRPVGYKWKDVPEITETKTIQQQKTILKDIEEFVIVEEDGKYIQKKIIKTKAEPVFSEVPLYDEEGKEIGFHEIPVIEEVTETNTIYDEEIYSRTHQGMIAQEVGQILTDMGLDSNDFAGFVYEEDRDRYGLRYVEFIAPLIKAVQELKAEIDMIKAG